MSSAPVPLQRPVVVLGGWGDVLGLPPAHLAKAVRRATGDDRVIAVGFGGCLTFDACRQRVLQRVEEAFPCADVGQTTEVDVIGFSMGGLVARFSAARAGEGPPLKRLRIARLYTISSPHRGAFMASVIAPGPLAQAMKPESAFLEQLDDQLARADYTLTPYVRLNDLIVSEYNAAPLEMVPYWVEPEPWTRNHSDAFRDPRLVADLARRLRGETPYTTAPPSPLPQ